MAKNNPRPNGVIRMLSWFTMSIRLVLPITNIRLGHDLLLHLISNGLVTILLLWLKTKTKTEKRKEEKKSNKITKCILMNIPLHCCAYWIKLWAFLKKSWSN